MISKDKIPVELDAANILAREAPLGAYNVGFERWPKGDYAHLFKGLPHNQCQSEHHGILLKGRARFRYSKDSVDELVAGDVYYAPPGHTWEVLEEGTEVLEFSPKGAAFDETLAVVGKNLEAWLASKKA